MTEELVFEGGGGVVYMPTVAMAAWQREYVIADTFKDEDEESWVFVPKTSRCNCKLFRVQHNADDPSHELAQVVDEKKCVLFPLRPMQNGEELTFDYFGQDNMVSSGSCHDSSAECSVSLTSSNDSQVVLTGAGQKTEMRLNAILESKFSKLADQSSLDPSSLAPSSLLGPIILGPIILEPIILAPIIHTWHDIILGQNLVTASNSFLMCCKLSLRRCARICNVGLRYFSSTSSRQSTEQCLHICVAIAATSAFGNTSNMRDAIFVGFFATWACNDCWLTNLC